MKPIARMKTQRLRLALIASMFVLGGCMTVGPDYKLPEGATINSPYANASIDGADRAPVTAGAAPSKWWRLYDDPALDELVNDALSSNADLRVAAANLARSRAEV